jgi:glyoxylase-like metal-dependent hydrolase (beta-lactamase superfamily II)
MIINTHEHIEHFGGNAAIKDISGAKILVHRLAVPLIEDMKNQLPPDSELKDLPEDIALYIKGRSMMYNNLRTTNVDFILDDNKSIPIGDYSLRIIYTSGHTKGHICIYEEEEKYYLPVIW